MSSVIIAASTQYPLGGTDPSTGSLITFKTVGLTGTCSVIPKIRKPGAGTSNMVAVPYTNVNTNLTVSAGTAITADGVYQVEATGPENLLDATVSSGTAIIDWWIVEGGVAGGGSGGGGTGGAVTIADGADVALGTTTDAVVTAPTGASATAISLLKGIDSGINTVPANPPPFQLELNDGTPVGDTAAHGMFVKTGGNVAVGSSGTGVLPSIIGGIDTSGNVQAEPIVLLNSSPTLSTQNAVVTFALLGAKAGTFLNPITTVSGLTTPDGGNGAQSLSVASQVYNGATWDRMRSAAGDAQAATGMLAATNMVWNGATWDRMPGTTSGVKVIPQAGELHLGEVGGNSLSLESTLTVSTSPAYSAGDNVGGLVTLTSAMRISAGTGVLQNLLVVDHSNQKPNLDIIFFKSTPAATFTDNGAFPTLSQADDALVICRVSIAAGDWVSVGGSGFASPSFQPKVVAASGSANLFMALNTSSTPTFVATTDIMVTTGFLRD